MYSCGDVSDARLGMKTLADGILCTFASLLTFKEAKLNRCIFAYVRVLLLYARALQLLFRN